MDDRFVCLEFMDQSQFPDDQGDQGLVPEEDPKEVGQGQIDPMSQLLVSLFVAKGHLECHRVVHQMAGEIQLPQAMKGDDRKGKKIDRCVQIGHPGTLSAKPGQVDHTYGKGS